MLKLGLWIQAVRALPVLGISAPGPCCPFSVCGLVCLHRLWGLVMRVGIEMEGQPPSAGRGSSAGWLPAVSCGGVGGARRVCVSV